MATFEENKAAIEANTEAISSANETLETEINRALSSESYFTATINENPVMYTDSLISASSLTDDYIGRIYLLLSSYDQYENGHVYKVMKSLSSGEYYYSDLTETNLHLENVTHLRYIEEGSDAFVWWKDPDDIVLQGETISKWAGTRLVYKSYDSFQMHETTAYPQGIDDGVTMVESTVRNQYDETPYHAEGLDTSKVYYCRLFPYTESGDVITTNPELNSFKLSNFEWGQFEKLLEEYPSYSDYLPQAGSAVTLKYMENDFFSSGGSNVMTQTRADVLSAIDSISAINTQWLVLGYNAHTPQFVKYRRPLDVDGMYDYVYVASVNDGVYDETFVDLEGHMTTKEVLSGDMFIKDGGISVGDRVYRKEYDDDNDEPIYYYVQSHVEAMSDTSSASGGFTYGSVDTFTVPMKITVGGHEYDFCGYNMSLHSQNLLTGAATALKSWAQFDAAEPVSANACNTYDTFEETLSDYGYYYRSTSDGHLHSIDVKGDSLEGSAVQYYNSGVVYRTDYAEHPFCDYHKNPIPSVEQATETYKANHVYLNLSGATLVAGTNYVIGDVILASDNVYEKAADGSRIYGCNLYSQSLFRQIINNTEGSKDSWWKKQNRWDTKGTSDWTGNNGVLLKLKKESGFIKSLIPIVNKTVLSTKNYMYVPKWTKPGSFYYHYVIDRMFALSSKEVNLTNANNTPEAAAVFADIYPDNASRVKKPYQANGSLGSASLWWLRSPSTGTSYHEYYVTNAGASGYFYAYTSYGCAPACTIG